MTEFPMGQGLAGHYGGLPDEFSDYAASEIVLLPVSFDKTTTYQKGSDKGPDALIEASRHLELYDIETDSEVYLKGIHTARSILLETSKEMLNEVYNQVYKYIRDEKFVITLGGEHSISSAPIKAHADSFKNISILQLDAHADLQDAYEGNPYSHASVMRRVQKSDSVSNIVSVGIRSMSIEEKKAQESTTTFFSHDIHEQDDWIEKVVNQLNDKVYITLDLDVFDPAIMPSTGTPEPGGLNWNQVMKLLRHVILKKNLIGCDVVELCPNPNNLAPDFLAAKLIYKILSYKFHLFLTK